MEVEVLPLNVVNTLQVFKGFEEEKCNVPEELFNRKMGQLQIKKLDYSIGCIEL
jgi:hypothetical protein